MSEFDNLKDDAEQYAKAHPQQVKQAEQDAEHAAESKLDPSGQQGQGNQQDQPGDSDHDNDQQGQDQGKGQ
jgi:hypothetical protein